MRKQSGLLIGMLLGLVSQVYAQPVEHRGPPPEALQACSGLRDGASCNFSLGDKQISGTCRTRPSGDAVCLPGGHRGHLGPPPEAVQACSGLQNGTSCSFSVEDKQISGTCRTGPAGEAPACLPSGHPGGRHAPPAEAVQACSGLETGANCSFTLNGKQLSGACWETPEETRACRPNRPHP